jgi:hypothetical protein
MCMSTTLKYTKRRTTKRLREPSHHLDQTERHNRSAPHSDYIRSTLLLQ